MGINKRLLIIYGLIILILWFGNVIYYITGDIKGSLFIKQYTEAELYPDESFSIHYITTDEHNWIEDIIFPEISEAEMWSNDEVVSIEGRYTMKRLVIEKNMFLHTYPHLKEWAENPEGEPIRLTKMITRSREGEEKEVDIGGVYLFPVSERVDEGLYQYMGRERSRNSEKWRGETEYRIKKKVQVDTPTSLFMQEIQSCFDIFINDTPLEEVSFPMVLKEGESLIVAYETKGDLSKIKGFLTGLDFKIQDDEGQQEVIRSELFQSMHGMPYYERSFIELLKKEDH